MAPTPVPDPAPLLVETFRTFERLYAHWMQSLVEGSGVSPARLLGDSLASFLGAVVGQPRTWAVALLRPLMEVRTA